MIPPSQPRPPRLALLALIVALVASGSAGVLSVRLNEARAQNDRLAARLARDEQELNDLRSRLTSGNASSVLERILQAVSRLRQLSIEHPVDAEILTNAELRSRVVDGIEKDSPRARVENSAKVLRALGLLGAGQDLYKILLDVQAEQVGGFYDTQTKKMVVGGGEAKDPSPLDRVLLAHEYTHALTDQHFGIGRLQSLDDQRKDDEAEAYLSLIEGDATLLMGEYAREVLTPSEQSQFSQEAGKVTTTKLDAAPPSLKTSLLFPYDEGARFVRALFEAGGNAAIDRAYRDPPTSTEQILHPERYLTRRDPPTPLTVPEFASQMGSGWKNIDEGGLGELDIREILDQFLPSTDANDAADGWDGGRYRAVEGSAGVVVAGLTAWDSESEAREATDTFADWLPERYGRKGSERRIPGFTGKAWEGPSGAGEVVRDGARMLFVLCPTLDFCEKARQGFGASFGSQTA